MSAGGRGRLHFPKKVVLILETQQKKVMLSGIQPSGDLTLGSYLGAIKNWVDRTDEFDNYYFMADMHTITVRQVPA